MRGWYGDHRSGQEPTHDRARALLEQVDAIFEESGVDPAADDLAELESLRRQLAAGTGGGE